MFTGRHKFHKSRFTDACDNFSRTSHRIFIVLRQMLARNLLNKNHPKSLDSLLKSFSPLLLQTGDVNGEILLTEILLHEVVTLESAVATNTVFFFGREIHIFFELM